MNKRCIINLIYPEWISVIQSTLFTPSVLYDFGTCSDSLRRGISTLAGSDTGSTIFK